MRRNNLLSRLTQIEKTLLEKNYQENLKRFEDCSQERSFSPVVRFFNPTGLGEWYLAELSPEAVGYGLCCLQEVAFGYVNLDELSTLRLPMGLCIEKDLYFDNKGLTLRDWHKKLRSSF